MVCLASEGQLQSIFVEMRVWLCLAPHAESFCSLRMAGKVSTAINLTTNVIMLEDIDEVPCGSEVETINLLLLHFMVALRLRYHYVEKCGLSWCIPSLCMIWLVLGI